MMADITCFVRAEARHMVCKHSTAKPSTPEDLLKLDNPAPKHTTHLR
jgi:hypothetical protein